MNQYIDICIKSYIFDWFSYLGLVNGIVDTSAERKLLINSANNATEELGNNETSRTEVKNKIMSVVNAIMSEKRFVCHED